MEGISALVDGRWSIMDDGCFVDVGFEIVADVADVGGG
jgi:hypothetical protein